MQRFDYPATSDSLLAQQYVADVRSVGVAEEQGIRTWRVSRTQCRCGSCLWKGWCRQRDDRRELPCQRGPVARLFKTRAPRLVHGQRLYSAPSHLHSKCISSPIIAFHRFARCLEDQLPFATRPAGACVISEAISLNKRGRATRSPTMSCALEPASKGVETKHECRHTWSGCDSCREELCVL